MSSMEGLLLFLLLRAMYTLELRLRGLRSYVSGPLELYEHKHWRVLPACDRCCWFPLLMCMLCADFCCSDSSCANCSYLKLMPADECCIDNGGIIPQVEHLTYSPFSWTSSGTWTCAKGGVLCAPGQFHMTMCMHMHYRELGGCMLWLAAINMFKWLF